MSLNDKYMSKEEQEQYSFGPWLVVVDSCELIPPQYKSYEKLILESEFCIKVPVNKDRQDLKPGMLMYKELVLMNQHMITILTYLEGRLVKEDIPISDIIYVTRGGELLNNYIAFGTKYKEFKICYYSVSYDINSKVINYIREHFMNDQIHLVKETLTKNFANNDLFKFFQKSNQQSGEYRPIAYQRECMVPYYANIGLGKLKNRFKQLKIEEIMFLVSENELVVISGDLDKAQKSSVDYSYRHLYIRLSSIKRIRMIQDDNNENLDLLELGFEKNRLLIKVEASFNYKYLRQLARAY